MVKKIENLLS